MSTRGQKLKPNRLCPLYPKHYPMRIAQARRIRELRAELIFNPARERAAADEWARMKRESVWTNSAAVGCVETGELFHSYTKAAAFYGVYGTLVLRSAKTGQPLSKNGFHFQFLNRERWDRTWANRNRQPVAVRCIETGERFSSMGEAGRACGVYAASISLSVRLGHGVNGKNLHFEAAGKTEKEGIL